MPTRKVVPPAATPPTPSLGAADLEGDAARVLERLLAHWRRAPHPELATRIVTLGATFRTPVDARSWDEVAARQRATDLSALLDAALDGTSSVLRTRIALLEKWPADPRLDRFVAHTYAHPPFTSTGARPFWTRLLSLGERLRDAEALETVRVASAGWSEAVPWEAFLLGHTARLFRAAQVRPVAPLDEPTRQALARVDALVAKQLGAPTEASRSIEALLDDVLRRPADDEPRRVLMDALLEQGHPRGELLALHFGAQGRALTPAEQKRERALLKQHRAELLGPLDAALGTELSFSRGFLSRASLKRSNANSTKLAIAQSAGHPLWATVEHLTGGGDVDVTCHEVMRSLTSLADSDVPLEVLARRAGLISLSGARVSDERHLRALTEPGAFPALRELHAVGVPWALSRLVAWPRARSLRRLGLEFHQPSGTPLGDEALGLLRHALALHVPTLTFAIIRYDSKGWGTRCVFDEAARTVELSLSLGNDNWQPFILPDVLVVLDAAKAAGFRPALDLEGLAETELVARVRRAL
ncbi:MAG: hypothetical protein ACOZQL_07810 [Myxococcota bacterium]